MRFHGSELPGEFYTNTCDVLSQLLYYAFYVMYTFRIRLGLFLFCCNLQGIWDMIILNCRISSISTQYRNQFVTHFAINQSRFSIPFHDPGKQTNEEEETDRTGRINP